MGNRNLESLCPERVLSSYFLLPFFLDYYNKNILFYILGFFGDVLLSYNCQIGPQVINRKCIIKTFFSSKFNYLVVILAEFSGPDI